MDIKQIKYLLTKYDEGNTTLEEEKVLQVYFTEEQEIDPDLLSRKQQFMLFKSGRDFKPEATSLESSIIRLIDEQTRQILPVKARIPLSRFLIAASIALILGISGIIIYQAQKSHTKETYTDPQLAYNEAQRALLFVSEKMNRGIEPLSNIAKINTGTEKLRNLGKMDQSLGMLNLVSFINSSSNLKK